MKFLAELMTDYRRLTPTDADGEGALEPSEVGTGEFDLDSDADIDDTMPEDGETDPEADPDMDGMVNQAVEDPDHQGLIRAVKNAHLIYKRKAEDGTFEELWIYNISSLRDEFTVRKAILAGTDIPVAKTRSPDGQQTYSLWSAGNAEMMHIEGLPN